MKLEGVEEFLDGLETFTREREWPAAFAARVFKIAHDGQHNRMDVAARHRWCAQSQGDRLFILVRAGVISTVAGTGG